MDNLEALQNFIHLPDNYEKAAKFLQKMCPENVVCKIDRHSCYDCWTDFLKQQSIYTVL